MELSINRQFFASADEFSEIPLISELRFAIAVRGIGFDRCAVRNPAARPSDGVQNDKNTDPNEVPPSHGHTVPVIFLVQTTGTDDG